MATTRSRFAAPRFVSGHPAHGCSIFLQQWLFDSPTAAPRLLKQRSGHHAPPHLVRYYGDDGKSILTAGADRALRYTSVVRDSRGYELSQGALQLLILQSGGTDECGPLGSIARKAKHLGVSASELKLPVITSLSYSASRSKDWDDIVTVSEGESLGRTWSAEGKRVGKWTLAAEGTVKVRYSADIPFRLELMRESADDGRLGDRKSVV